MKMSCDSSKQWQSYLLAPGFRWWMDITLFVSARPYMMTDEPMLSMVFVCTMMTIIVSISTLIYTALHDCHQSQQENEEQVMPHPEASPAQSSSTVKSTKSTEEGHHCRTKPLRTSAHHDSRLYFDLCSSPCGLRLCQSSQNS